MQSPTQTPVVPYSTVGQKRKKIRLAIFGAVLVVTTLVFVRHRALVLNRLSIAWHQTRCMHYGDSSSQPAFVFAFDDAVRAHILKDAPQLQVIKDDAPACRLGRVADDWRKLCNAAQIPAQMRDWFEPEGTIFLGVLKSADGQSKLVAVHVVATHTNTRRGLPGIVTHVISPKELRTDLVITQQLFGFGPVEDTWERGVSRIFPGRVDPRDPSRFEARVVYESYGQEVNDVLIGRLGSGGVFELSALHDRLLSEIRY